jgi:hypothetical protein
MQLTVCRVHVHEGEPAPRPVPSRQSATVLTQLERTQTNAAGQTDIIRTTEYMDYDALGGPEPDPLAVIPF